MADIVHFPKMLYTADGQRRIVSSQAEQTALGPLWAESPMAFNIVTAPSMEQAHERLLESLRAPSASPTALVNDPLPASASERRAEKKGTN